MYVGKGDSSKNSPPSSLLTTCIDDYLNCTVLFLSGGSSDSIPHSLILVSTGTPCLIMGGEILVLIQSLEITAG